MTKDEFLMAVKSEDGVWVLGRNIAIERLFENQTFKPKELIHPTKVYCDGDEYVMISFDEYTSPAIFAYSVDNVEVLDTNGEITLNLRGKAEYYDYYVRPDCSPEEYLARFMRTWKLNQDEYRKYSVSQELKNLSTVLIDPLAK